MSFVSDSLETPIGFAPSWIPRSLLIVGQWTSPADNEKNIKWTQEAWEKLQPYTEPGVYVNDLGEEGDQHVKAAYGPNYERLVALKNKYDPTNFFHQNQNIKPTVSSLS